MAKELISFKDNPEEAAVETAIDNGNRERIIFCQKRRAVKARKRNEVESLSDDSLSGSSSSSSEGSKSSDSNETVDNCVGI